MGGCGVDRRRSPFGSESGCRSTRAPGVRALPTGNRPSRMTTPDSWAHRTAVFLHRLVHADDVGCSPGGSRRTATWSPTRTEPNEEDVNESSSSVPTSTYAVPWPGRGRPWCTTTTRPTTVAWRSIGAAAPMSLLVITSPTPQILGHDAQGFKQSTLRRTLRVGIEMPFTSSSRGGRLVEVRNLPSQQSGNEHSRSEPTGHGSGKADRRGRAITRTGTPRAKVG